MVKFGRWKENMTEHQPLEEEHSYHQADITTGGRDVPQIIRLFPRGRIYVGKDAKVTDENPSLRVLKLGEGVSPFGPPPEYFEIRQRLEAEGAFARAGLVYGGSVDNTPALGFIRERFGDVPYIALSQGGSDEILERIVTQLIEDPYKRKVHIMGIGPHYPHINNFAKRYGFGEISAHTMRLLYGSVFLDLHRPLSETVLETIRRCKEDGRHNVLVYLCNPDTPKGDSVDIDLIKDLADITARQEKLLLVDEAFGDALEDENSAMPLTAVYSNLIILRSLSKGVGLPGERIGFAGMSAGVGEAYDRVRRVYDISGPTQLLANEIFNPDIILPHLDKVREKTRIFKHQLLNQLAIIGIPYLSTDFGVPILLLDGRSGGFHSRLLALGIETASGMAFAETHPGLSDRYVRMTIPGNEEDILEVIQRIKTTQNQPR